MRYVVKAGDSLQSIALKQLGSESEWTTIWHINKAHLRSGKPDTIYIGEVLDLPDPPPKAPPPAPPSLSTSGKPAVVGSDDPNEVILIVNDKKFAGWESAKIKKSLEAASGSFTLTVTDKWADLSEPWPVFPGDECAVKIGFDTIITGYVDDVEIELGPTSHSMTVTGRDRTADVVDCSAAAKPGEWRGKTLDAIAKDLCAPVSVAVAAEVSTGGTIPVFRIQPGETIFEALERAAKGRKLLITSSNDGRLLLTRSGSMKFDLTLKEGENIKSITASYSAKERFSKYVVEGQPAGEGQKTKGIYARATDDQINRYRPLVIIAEEEANQAYANERAAWEAKIRAARAAVASVTVQGFRTPGGAIWAVNRLVAVDSPSARIKGELLISDLEFSVGNDGTTTVLTLKRKDAYTEEVEIKKEAEPATLHTKTAKPDPKRKAAEDSKRIGEMVNSYTRSK